MSFWLGCARKIDRLTQGIAKAVFWLTLSMILIGAFNAVARYSAKFTGLNLATNAMIEIQWYLFSLVFLLGGAYTLSRGGHVRVDVVYGRYSPRVKAWINLVGTLAFLLPFCALMIAVTWPGVRSSWHVWEQSPDPGGLPRYPIKTMVPIAFFFLGLQGISEVVKQVAILRGKAEPPSEESGASDIA